MRPSVILQKCAALFLYRTGASVLINMKFEGELTQRTNRGFTYGCVGNGRWFLPNGEEFQVPSGRFTVELRTVEVES